MTSAPRSARSIVANGPARTVEQSATRIPTSGPVGVASIAAGSGVGLGAIGRSYPRSGRGRLRRRLVGNRDVDDLRAGRANEVRRREVDVDAASAAADRDDLETLDA